MATEMATLVGTEKQITWAEDIRAKWLTKSERDLVLAQRYADDEPEDAAGIEQAITAGKRQTSARWWIETRALHLFQINALLTGAKTIRDISTLISVEPTFA